MRFAKLRITKRNRTGGEKEIEREWESLYGNKEVDISGRIDQLNDLRFKIQSVNKNWPVERRRGGFWEIEYRVWGRKFRKKKLIIHTMTMREN